jgi:pimeloyl-ACP methyl ester carboxylesterase
MATVRTRRVTVAGVMTPVLESGDPRASEAVVFVHGNPGFGAEWQDSVAAVGDFARAIAPDMPAYGGADRPKHFSYTVKGYGEHLAGILDELGITKVHLVLHDFGGPWGLWWAGRHRDQVASIVLVDTGVLPRYHGHYLAWFWFLPGLAEVGMWLRSRLVFRLALKHGQPRGLGREFVDGMYDAMDAGTVRAMLNLYRSTGLRGIVRGGTGSRPDPYDVPALIVWGAADPYIRPRRVHNERQFFPRADVHIFDDSGHWPHVDNPERFAATLLPFLRSTVGPARQPGAAVTNRSGVRATGT